MGNDSYVTHEEGEDYRKEIYSRIDLNDKAINEIDKTVNGHEIILKQITFWGKTIVGILTSIMVTLMVQIILQFAR